MERADLTGSEYLVLADEDDGRVAQTVAERPPLTRVVASDGEVVDVDTDTDADREDEDGRQRESGGERQPDQGTCQEGDDRVVFREDG